MNYIFFQMPCILKDDLFLQQYELKFLIIETKAVFEKKNSYFKIIYYK